MKKKHDIITGVLIYVGAILVVRGILTLKGVKFQPRIGTAEEIWNRAFN